MQRYAVFNSMHFPLSRRVSPVLYQLMCGFCPPTEPTPAPAHGGVPGEVPTVSAHGAGAGGRGKPNVPHLHFL